MSVPDAEPTFRSPATWLAVMVAFPFYCLCAVLNMPDSFSIPLTGIVAGVLGARFHQAHSRREAGK